MNNYCLFNYIKLNTNTKPTSISQNLNTQADNANVIFAFIVYCHIELRTWGYNDMEQIGYAKVNGHREVNYERPGLNDQIRGFNFNILRRTDCRTTESEHFDTYKSNSASADLAQYLGSLAPGTVLYGVTCDEPTQALQPVARNALQDIGINVTNLHHRGKLTFVAVVGQASSTVFRTAGPGGDNLFMNALVFKTIKDPSGERLDLKKAFVCLRFHSFTIN